MKIVLEDVKNKKKVAVETNEIECSEILRDVKNALIVFGFYPNTVNESIQALAEELEDNND